MKVLFVDQFGKTTGRDTLALANLIDDENVQMTAYVSDTTEIPVDIQYNIQIQKGFRGAYEGSAFNKAKNYLRALGELKKYIKENHFDIVHLQWFSLPWIEWIYVKSLKRYSKIVITVHDVIPFDNRPLEMQSLDRIYSVADQLLVHTEKVKEEFKKNYKANTQISVITQGFCYKPDYVKIDKKLSREKLGIPEDAVVFLYYGTIRPSKGLDILMKAVVKAKKYDHNVYLLAVGAFHKVDEKYYYSLANEVTKKGSKVDFGFLPFELEKYYFSSADVLVLPYTEGTQSGVAQLGLMYDLPLIASDISCMDEVAKYDVNALLFNSGDVDALTECLCNLAKDSEKRARFAIASKYLGETVFSLENKAQIVKAVYRKITIRGKE